MIVPVIFSSLLGILFVLYIVGYAKKVTVLQRFSFPLLLPCSLGISIPILLLKFPDSLHLTVLSSAAIFFAILKILIEPLNIKSKLIVEYLCRLFSNILWIVIFYSIFYIYEVSVSFIIVMLAVYFCMIIFSSIKFEMKTLKRFFILFVATVICFFLNFISILSVLNKIDPSSICLLLGTILLIGYTFTSLSTRFKTGVKHSRIIINLLYAVSELLIYASSVLLLF